MEKCRCVPRGGDIRSTCAFESRARVVDADWAAARPSYRASRAVKRSLNASNMASSFVIPSTLFVRVADAPATGSRISVPCATLVLSASTKYSSWSPAATETSALRFFAMDFGGMVKPRGVGDNDHRRQAFTVR